MSIRARRNSLLKSSISINTIRDSAVSFNEGLSKSNTTAGSIVQKTNDNNNFKRRLIANDNQYFRKRQENVRRKAREDELEASTVQGVAKKTGSLTATSTRGFLGRILDFFGIVLLGWFINTLPKIIESIRGLINRIGKLTGLLTGFIGSISNFLVDFGTQIGTATANLFRFDGDRQYAEASESLTETENGLTKLRRRLIESFNLFSVPQNFGLNSFDEGLIIKSDDPDAEKNQEEDPNQVQDNKVTDEKDTSKNKPKGFMRGLTGAIDFATFGMTDLDKRGDLFDNKEEEKEEVAEFDPGAYTAVTDSEAKEQIEKEDNADMVSGIKDQSFIKDVESQQAQSQGETVETVNKEREDTGEQDKQVQGLRTKIEGFMSNMFGTKRKREDKTDDSGIDAEIEKTAAQLKGSGSDLKSNMAKYAESIKKDGDSSKITPMMRDRSNLQGKRKSGRDTIYIIEKPVKIGGGDSGSVGGGGGGSSPSFSNGSGDNTNNLMKKIQKVILQS